MCLNLGLQQGRHTLSQGAAPGSLPSLVTGPGHCHQDIPRDARFCWLGMPIYCIHTALILVPLTPCLHTLLVVCTVITSWASKAVMRTCCCGVPCPCAQFLASQEALGRHLGGVIQQWYLSGKQFLFYWTCQMPPRNCLDKFFFGLIFFNNKEDWIIPCNVKVSLLSSVNVKYNQKLAEAIQKLIHLESS